MSTSHLVSARDRRCLMNPGGRPPHVAIEIIQPGRSEAYIQGQTSLIQLEEETITSIVDEGSHWQSQLRDAVRAGTAIALELPPISIPGWTCQVNDLFKKSIDSAYPRLTVLLSLNSIPMAGIRDLEALLQGLLLQQLVLVRLQWSTSSHDTNYRALSSLRCLASLKVCSDPKEVRVRRQSIHLGEG